MIKIKIRPLTVNQAYCGRKFSTPALKAYKEAIGYLAPKMSLPEGKLQATYRFGVSSKCSDLDNCIKVSQDALAEKYGFNDNRIYKMVVEKVDVKKGEEFVEFEFKELENRPT
jgi:Holliday junction resolvase RusA-like endonuclease